VFGGYTDELKPRKQSFLLSTDRTENHLLSEINKHHLTKAAGFSDEQCVLINNRVVVLGDQYSIQVGSALTQSKNLYVLEHGKWNVEKID
jgi:hypothetical protein